MAELDVDRVIAEEVMEWTHYAFEFPSDDMYENAFHIPMCYARDYSPSTNPAQFDEAFRKAGGQVQLLTASYVLGGNRGTLSTLGACQFWQLAPLADKAKALAEAALEVKP